MEVMWWKPVEQWGRPFGEGAGCELLKEETWLPGLMVSLWDWVTVDRARCARPPQPFLVFL